MTTLGIGTPVRIGWTPDDKCHPRCLGDRLKRGVIVDGPERIEPDELGCVVHIFGRAIRAEYPGTYWRVRVGSRKIGCNEHLLFPDDGETEADRARGMAVET